MIRPSQWHRLPSVPVKAALPQMRWTTDTGALPAAETAALMLFVALNFMSTTWTDDKDQFQAMAEGSYVDLNEATGLSRKLIAAGLQRLVELELIASEGSHQKRRYKIGWPPEHRFFKLPCQAIVKGNVIRPFQNFTLRSKHELNALKLYLYLASIRHNHSFYSMASYETIFERTKIPERDVRKAISLMINCGLMLSVDRDHKETADKNEPNKYFLAGYHALVRSPSTSPASESSEPEAARVPVLPI